MALSLIILEVERRRRSLSNASRRSSVSISGRSSSCEELLPKPVCRKHSTSNNSLNQIHIFTNGHGSGAVSPISGRRTPTSPIFKRPNYCFAHQSADDDYDT